MKKSRFTDEQIIGFLKQVEGGVQVKDRCPKHSFSDATFYKWRSRLGGQLRRRRGPGRPSGRQLPRFPDRQLPKPRTPLGHDPPTSR